MLSTGNDVTTLRKTHQGLAVALQMGEHTSSPSTPGGKRQRFAAIRINQFGIKHVSRHKMQPRIEFTLGGKI